MKLTDIKNSLNEISAIGGLKQVVKGNTDRVEGIKLSKEMAQAMIDWFNSSPYGRKYPKAAKARLHLSLGIMSVMGLDRYAKHKGAKEELKYIKDLSKAMRDNVNEESLNEGKYDDLLDKLADIVGNAKSFMDIGKELKSNKIKYSFGTSPLPMYIIDKPVKIAILNKKYADGAEREVGSTAIGLMESMKMNEAKYDIGMARKGNGLTVYNKAEEENGDYKNVAHIDNKGKIKYYDKKVPSKIKKQIEAEAKKMMEIKIEGTMKLTDLLNEDVYVKNKETGNVYQVKNANPSKHEPPSDDEVDKAKSEEEPKKDEPKKDEPVRDENSDMQIQDVSDNIDDLEQDEIAEYAESDIFPYLKGKDLELAQSLVDDIENASGGEQVLRDDLKDLFDKKMTLESVNESSKIKIKESKGTMKLKDLLKESFEGGKVYSNPFHTSFVKENDMDRDEESNEMTNEQKMAFLEAVKSYKKFGESIYRKEGLAKVYESIRGLVEVAGKNMVKETEGSFDGITVGRHVKRMNESFKVFEKTLKEVGTLQQRLESTYDEIGEVLGKYYEINELEEGNEFGAARAKAIANGDSEFEVDGKTYPVKGVDKDDKENAKEFTNESKSMKLTSMLNESFGFGELPSSKLMKMKVSAKEMMDSVNPKKKSVNEGFATWEMRFSDMNLGGVKLSKKNVYRVKARNTVEAIKKAAKMAGVEKNWIATETHSLKKIG